MQKIQQVSSCVFRCHGIQAFIILVHKSFEMTQISLLCIHAETLNFKIFLTLLTPAVTTRGQPLQSRILLINFNLNINANFFKEFDKLLNSPLFSRDTHL